MMFARTKRLTLRPGWPEDAPALSRAIGHETVVAKLARAPWPYALEDAETFLALPRGAAQPSYLICAREGDIAEIAQVIGLGALADLGLFGFDAITNLCLFAKYAAEIG